MAASHYSGMLPDPLRLKLGGLQPQQLQVYEDFSLVRTLQIQAGTRYFFRMMSDVSSTDASLNAEEQRNGIAAYSAESPALPPAQVAEALPPVPTILSGPQAMEKFAVGFLSP